MKSLLEVLKEVRSEIDYENEQDLVGSGLYSSLDILNVITALEDEYDIDIPPTEIVITNFRSMETIQSLIDRVKK